MTERQDRRRRKHHQTYARMWDPNELSRLFTQMRQRSNLPAIRLHDCRHGFASLSFAAGIDLLTVSKSLGHSSLAVTSGIYVHQLDATKRVATKAFEAYVSAAVTPLPKVPPVE